MNLQYSELFYVLSNAFAIAGLIMASFSGIKSRAQTVIDQIYNIKPFFTTKGIDKKAVNIPRNAIKLVLKEKHRQGLGLLFAAIGMAVPVAIDTTKPANGKWIITFIFAFIIYFLGVFMAFISAQFRAGKIVKKLERGDLKPSNGYSINIAKEYHISRSNHHSCYK